MKSYLIVFSALILIMTTLKTNAQKAAYKFQVNPYSGYEQNLIKSPEVFNVSADSIQDKTDLWVNAPFIGGALHFDTYTKKKKHMFGVSVDYKKLLINPYDQVNGSEFESQINYKLNKFKKFKNYTEISFNKFIKTGAEDQDNLFGQPLSYSKTSILNKSKFYLGKRLISETKPFFNIKNYQNDQFSLFRFNEPGIQQTIYLKNKKKKYLFATGVIKQKNYIIEREYYSPVASNLGEDEELDELLDSVSTTYREYFYKTLGGGVYIPIKKKTSIKLRGTYTQMNDKIQGTFGYNQWLAEATIKTTYKRFKLNLTTSYISKDYRDFMVSGLIDDKVLLQYDYLKFNGGLKYKLNKNFDICFKIATKDRFSNVDNPDKKFFRSYHIAEYQIGIVWSNKKYYKKKKK